MDTGTQGVPGESAGGTESGVRERGGEETDENENDYDYEQRLRAPAIQTFECVRLVQMAGARNRHS